jgi:hypothetical protein
MSEEIVDVNTPDPSAGDNSGAAPVPAVPVMPQDRPEINVLAEMNRKYSRLENQIGQVMTLLSQQAQQPAQPQKGQATDEELWSLAQQGDRSAFEMYQERIADRRAQALYERKAQEGLVDQQLNALAARYPVFNDTGHPLTQTVQSAYQIMVNRGYQPGKATLLDAMKTAIADRPDLVADMVGRSPEAARVSATRRAQAGQTGATVRDSAPGARAGTTRVTPQQAQLARAYGVKDPGKAIERFRERQESGRSNLGMVANAIQEEL